MNWTLENHRRVRIEFSKEVLWIVKKWNIDYIKKSLSMSLSLSRSLSPIMKVLKYFSTKVFVANLQFIKYIEPRNSIHCPSCFQPWIDLGSLHWMAERMMDLKYALLINDQKIKRVRVIIERYANKYPDVVHSTAQLRIYTYLLYGFFT